MRAMRREDRRMPPDEAEALLHRAEVLRLGFTDEHGPYVVPLNFGYEDGCIYVHGAPDGRRMDFLSRNPRVCFEVDESEVVSAEHPCGYSARFQSVIGYGRACVLETAEEKLNGLQALMRHYGGSVQGMDPAAIDKTAVVKIAIESMDGKRHDIVRGSGGQQDGVPGAQVR